MLTFIESIVFLVILFLTIFYFLKPLYLRYKLVKLGMPEKRSDRMFLRIADAVTSFFLLFCSVKSERPFTGFIHFFILYGSLTFDTITVYHIIEGFNPGVHVNSIHALVAESFGIMVLVAVVYFSIKRWVVRKSSYTYGTMESFLIYALLVTVTLSFYLYEGASLALHPQVESMAFVGNWIAGWMPASNMAVSIWWWVHIINVFMFILYVSRSKYMHMFMGPLNIMLKTRNSSSYIKTLDLENAESYGVENLSGMTWKDLLDGFACIDCGRCEDYCPAAQSGKPLSPKNIMIKMRDSLLKEGKKKLEDSEYELPMLMGDVYEEDEIWTCTTCGACMSVCPVENEHIPKIIGLRQSGVMMDARFPQELVKVFKNIETNSNPWGFGESGRADWAEGLDVRVAADSDENEILYWPGCAGSFDDLSKKVSVAMVKIMNHAGIKFSILGTEEKCCGDPARRAGNEYVFQMLAMENIETIKRYGVKKIVTACPHGYNMFKNDYPEVSRMLMEEDFDVEVVHHSEFLMQLVNEGKIKLNSGKAFNFTYHDPCYLGRHNEIYKPGREIIKKTGGTITEMKHNHRHSLCCGAGGGLMFTEETIGTRINHMRTDEVIETGAEVVCTACPFCSTMLSDGIKDKEKGEEIQSRDIAEIVAEHLAE
ncbi:MAG: (Fe-S)-binding protein [Holophagae bacterium]|nr:(Fe-S)-binding protein [Holophagae bacterium]